MNAVSLNNLWSYLQGLSLSASNQRWLGERLIEAAREDKEMLIRFFLQHGIDINRYLIFAIGGKDCKFKGRIQDRKRQVIEHLSARGYKNFEFYDDNEENLNEVAQMSRRIGVDIKTIKAC